MSTTTALGIGRTIGGMTQVATLIRHVLARGLSAFGQAPNSHLDSCTCGDEVRKFGLEGFKGSVKHSDEITCA